MSARIVRLRNALAAEAIQGRLVVTAELLETEDPILQWMSLLDIPALTLYGATIDVSEDDDPGSVAVHGEADLLELGRQPVTLILMESKDSGGFDPDAIEAILIFSARIPLWRPADWFAPPPYPWSVAAFPEALSLRDAALVVSSCDFAEPLDFTYSIAAPVTPIGAPLRAGLNFSAVIDGYDGVLGPLRPLGILPERPVRGLIGKAEDGGGPQLSFIFYAGESADGLVSLSVSGFAAFGLKITALGCSGPIGPDARNFGAVTAAAEIAIGDHVLALKARLSATHASLSGMFDDDHMLSLADLEHAFGLGGLETLLPGPMDLLGNIALTGFEAGLDLETLTLSRFSFEITTEKPWSLIDHVLEVKPYFQLTREAGGAADEDEAVTTIRVGADWLIGSTRFTVDLEPESGDFMAGMAVGESLDAGAMLAHLLPGVSPPDCVLLDVDIEGNINDEVFSLRIETEGGWHVDIGGGSKIAIEDIELTAKYGLGDLTGHLAGDITIAGWRLSVDLVLDDVCTFDVMIPELKVGELADSFLTLVGLPADLPDFTLTDMLISITPSTGLFSIEATSSTTFTLFSGFEAQISGFSAASSTVGGKRRVDAALDIILTIDGVPLVAAAQYTHVETGLAPTSEWLFTLRQGDAPLSLAGLAEALERLVGLNYPLSAGDLAVRDLTLCLSLGGADRQLAGACTLTSGGKDYATFRAIAERRGEAQWQHLVNVDVSLAGVDPGRLPMVGPMLRQSGLRLETLRVTHASQAMTTADGDRLQHVAKDLVLPLPVIEGLDVALLSHGLDGLRIGLSVADRRSADAAAADALPAAASSGAATSGEAIEGEILPAARTPGPAAPATPVDATRWFAIDRSFGPLTLERLGFSLQNERITLLFDSHISLQGFTLSLAGLGLGTRLDRFDPDFRLDGIGIGFDAGPVGVSGGLLKRDAGLYAGAVRLEAAGYAIGAIGQYAAPDPSRPTQGRDSSIFVFGVLEAPLGGPPICYVRGVAAGLGINSSLALPAVDAIQDFSLVQAALPGSGFGGMDLNAVLRAMDRDIHPTAGSEWLAAGLHFTSFELVQSVALVTVPLDRPDNITVIGLSRMSMPPEAPNPIAMLEIGFTANFRPKDNLLAIEGQLTRNSFLFSHDCHPTGGFAFYAWFAGQHEGDFVLSLGGYHPRYPVPDHFPRPRRLVMGWQLSSALQIKGTSYFALVPNAVMAGGAMEASWESGPVRAWFSCSYDFLIQWKPFAYDVSIAIEVGAEVCIDLWLTSITIGFSIGAGLRLHGPPFGGEVSIDLDVVSFTISFGTSRPDRTPLTWAQFRQAFLPAQIILPPGRSLPQTDPAATNTVCLVRPSGGLMHDLSQEGGTVQWVLNNERLSLEIVCTVPVKQARFNGQPLQGMPDGAWSGAIGVAPAGVLSGQMRSELSMTLVHLDPLNGGSTAIVGMAVEPVVRSVPAALWRSQSADRDGNVPEPSLDGTRVVEGALCGAILRPVPLDVHATDDMPVADLQFTQPRPLGFAWSPAGAPPARSSQAMRDVLVAKGFVLRPGTTRRRRFGHSPQHHALGVPPT